MSRQNLSQIRNDGNMPTSAEYTSHDPGILTNGQNPSIELERISRQSTRIANSTAESQGSSLSVPASTNLAEGNAAVPTHSELEPLVGTDQLLNGSQTAVNAASHANPTTGPVSTHVNASSSPYLEAKEWKSKWLQLPALLSIGLLTIVLIGVIMGLTIWSASSAKGIASVDLTRERDFLGLPDFQLGISLLWTFFPVLIINFYVLCLASLVAAASERQPYVELRRPRKTGVGAAPEKSIFLAYQSCLAVKAPFKALQHNHYMLAYSFTIKLIGNFILTALASHLVIANVVSARRDGVVVQSTYYEESGFGALSDLVPILDIVAATRVYRGRPIPWTTSDSSYLDVSLDGVPKNANLTIPTQSFSASLDCNVLSEPYEFKLGHTSGGWKFDIADRNCSLSNQSFTLGLYHFIADYIVTYTNESCDSMRGESRFVVVAAVNADPSAPDTGLSPGSGFSNKTAISCIPRYYNQNGMLAITVDSVNPSQITINDFTPNGNGPITGRPSFAYNFEVQLSEGSVIDDTARVYANNFGRLLYLYAKTLSPSYFDGEVLRNAVEDLYSSAFAVMAQQYLVESKQPSTKVSVTIYESGTYLFVVLPIAITVMVILVFILIMCVWIWLYSDSKKHPSCQYESSDGLLGAAASLRNSDVMSELQSIPAGPCQGKVAEEFKETARNKKEGWMFENWDKPDLAAIKRTADAEEFGFRRIFRK